MSPASRRPVVSQLAMLALSLTPVACGASSNQTTGSDASSSGGGDATAMSADSGSSGGSATSSGGNGSTSSGSGSSSGSGGEGGSSSGSSSGVVAEAGSGSSGGSGGGSSGSSTMGEPCAGDGGLACQVPHCTDGGTTSISGAVYDPAAANVLYGAMVYVPADATLPAIVPGTSTCGACGAPVGRYVTATSTDATGHFVLTGVPAGTHIPVVAQVGKWRRETFVDVTACQDNPQPRGTIRLPGRRSEGDMPQIALLTGGCDDMGCFLTGLGIDPTEFVAPHAGGAVDVYQGLSNVLGTSPTPAAGLSGGTAGDCTTSACPLWASKASLESYDLVVLSCECSQNNQTKPAVSMTALHDWLDEGGRVFANHQQYTWFSNSPSTDFHGTATWSTAGSITNNGSVDDAVDTSYPKGLAYSQWLGAAGALADAGPPPALLLSSVGASASAVSTTPPQATARWVYDPGASDSVRYLTFETPIGGTPGSAEAGAPRYCGKTAFADVHAQGTLLSSASDVPNGCGSNAGMLSAQEKSLEFLFFDLSACVAPDSIAPPGPPPSGP